MKVIVLDAKKATEDRTKGYIQTFMCAAFLNFVPLVGSSDGHIYILSSLTNPLDTQRFDFSSQIQEESLESKKEEEEGEEEER